MNIVESLFKVQLEEPLEPVAVNLDQASVDIWKATKNLYPNGQYLPLGLLLSATLTDKIENPTPDTDSQEPREMEEIHLTPQLMKRYIASIYSTTRLMATMENNMPIYMEFAREIIEGGDQIDNVLVHRTVFGENSEQEQDILTEFQEQFGEALAIVLDPTQGKNICLLSGELALKEGSQDSRFVQYISFSFQNDVLEIQFYFMEQQDPDLQQRLMEVVLEELSLLEGKNIRFDFLSLLPRHNLIGDYPEISLAVWAKYVMDDNFSPQNAMAILSYNLLPYILEFNEEEEEQ